MNKKKLPKAIRPNVTHTSSPKSRPKMSEPMPEARGSANTRANSSIATSKVAEIAPDERRARARNLVERFSLWSGVAGLLPVPIVDLAAVGGLQIQMLRRISQIYDVPFSRKSRQSAHSRPCRDDNSCEYRTWNGQHDKKRACSRNRNWCDYHAGALYGRHLRNRYGVYRTLCLRRDTA